MTKSPEVPAWIDLECGCSRSPDVARDVPCPIHNPSKLVVMLDETSVESALALANMVSPSQDVFAMFHRMVEVMTYTDEPTAAVVIALVQGILDGLRYGNWPQVR